MVSTAAGGRRFPIGTLSEMPYALRTRTCTRCGESVTKRMPLTGPVWCLRCGIERMVEAMLMMHEHRGPQYQASVAAGRQAADQIRARKGPIYDRWYRGCQAGVSRFLQAIEPGD